MHQYSITIGDFAQPVVYYSTAISDSRNLPSLRYDCLRTAVDNRVEWRATLAFSLACGHAIKTISSYGPFQLVESPQGQNPQGQSPQGQSPQGQSPPKVQTLPVNTLSVNRLENDMKCLYPFRNISDASLAVLEDDA
jgi:hypothetical protein